MGFIAWIVVGLIAGWLAGQVMKGGGYGVLVDIIPASDNIVLAIASPLPNLSRPLFRGEPGRKRAIAVWNRIAVFFRIGGRKIGVGLNPAWTILTQSRLPE